jgi:hypothetical protein
MRFCGTLAGIYFGIRLQPQSPRVQNQEPATANPRSIDALEIDGSSFLLLAAGVFFGLETLSRYETFIHQTTSVKSIAAEGLILIIGSATISATYLLLSYSCWKGRSNPDSFVTAQVFSGILIFAYFAVQITTTAFSHYAFMADMDYAQFVTGYGSVTIFVEMLVLLFAYRAYKIIESRPYSP